MTTTIPDPNAASYRDAYSRINGLVVVGEGLADRHFRLLSRAIPEDRQELERLAAMEGRHAKAFVGCGRHLGVKPDLGLARQLFAPLHGLFLERDRHGDLAGCLVIQGLAITLRILRALAVDLQTIGIDPIELLASFSERFQQSLESIGFEPPAARRILARAAATLA